MNNKNLIKNFVNIGIGTIIGFVVSILTTPIIVRIVDPFSYGKYSFFSMYALIGLNVLLLGLDQSFVRFYYDYDNETYKINLFKMCIFPSAFLALFVSLIVIFISIVQRQFLGFDIFQTIILCIYTFFSLLSRFLLLYLRLEYKTKLYSFLNVIQKILFLIISLLLFYFMNNNNYVVLFISLTLSYILQVFGLLIVNRDKFNLHGFFISKDRQINYKKILKYAYPFIFSSSISVLFQSIDKIFLKHYSSFYEVGIYSAAMNIIHVFSVIQITFNTLWTPIALEYYSKNKNNNRMFINANDIITFIMFSFGLLLILSRNIFGFVLGGDYIGAKYIIPFLVFYPIMYTISETTVIGLLFQNKSKFQIVISVLSCLFNALGNYLLVPKYGCIGASISTGLSYIIFFFLRTYFSSKCYKINFNYYKISIITFLTIIYAFFNSFVDSYIINLIMFCFIFIILCILYRNVINKIIKFFKNI